MSFSILKSTSLISFMTLISRISGLARDVVFARFFGAGIVLDVFVVAFKIPNLLRRFFAEGAFAQAFVPVLSEYKTKKTEEETQELASGVVGTLGTALFVITVPYGRILFRNFVFVKCDGLSACVESRCGRNHSGAIDDRQQFACGRLPDSYDCSRTLFDGGRRCGCQISPITGKGKLTNSGRIDRCRGLLILEAVM